MPTINEAYINALLADATYALSDKTTNGVKGIELTKFLEKRMTPTLAKYIGDNFTVITHTESNDFFGSGFDATVWRDNDGNVYVSMRESEGLGGVIESMEAAA